MPRRNRDRKEPESFEELPLSTLEDGSESPPIPPAPSMPPALGHEPKAPKPVQLLPDRTETLERFAKTLPGQDQFPFQTEIALEARRANGGKKKTVRLTRDEWNATYQTWKTLPRY